MILLRFEKKTIAKKVFHIISVWKFEHCFPSDPNQPAAGLLKNFVGFLIGEMTLDIIRMF